MFSNPIIQQETVLHKNESGKICININILDNSVFLLKLIEQLTLMKCVSHSNTFEIQTALNIYRFYRRRNL